MTTAFMIPIPYEPVLRILEGLAPVAPAGRGVEALHGSPLAGIEGAVATSWDRITELLGRVMREGWQSVREEAAGVAAFIRDRARELGQGAQEMMDLVLEKIRKAISQTTDLMLSNVRAEITVGTRLCTLVSAKILNTVMVSGELAASLEALCKLVGEGQLTVEVSYAPATA